jgi:hypothetical protein
VQIVGLGATGGTSIAMSVAATRQYLGAPEPGLHTQQTVGMPEQAAQMWSVGIDNHGAWPELAAVWATTGLCAAAAFKVWRGRV